MWHRFFLGTVCSWVQKPTAQLFAQLCCTGVVLPETLKQPRPCQLEMEQVRMLKTGRKTTFSRKARRRAKVNTQTREEFARNTNINTCKNCGRTGQWAKDCWIPGGGAYDNSNSDNNNTNKGCSQMFSLTLHDILVLQRRWFE